jgi:hypothetical protein
VLARDVDHNLLDRATLERPRRHAGVVGSNRTADAAADREALAADRERSELGSDVLLGDLLLVDEERRGANKRRFRLVAAEVDP